MDYSKFRQQFNEGQTVSVNHKALITRALTKYPVDFALFRELLQNSADAQANSASIEFYTSENIDVTTAAGIEKIHTAPITRLRFQNDGLEFTAADWNRLKEIASGNPNEGKIGAFGVGFYSVFELTDEPLVHSGNEIMNFRYKDVQLHYDFQKVEQFQKGTLIDLVYKEAIPLPELAKFVGFLIQSFMLVNLNEISLVLKTPNNNKIELLKLNKTTLKSTPIVPENTVSQSPNKMFKLAGITRSEVEVTIKYLNSTQKVDHSGSKLFSFGKRLVETLFTSSTDPTDYTSVEVKFTEVNGIFDVSVSKEFSNKMKATIMKPPPRKVNMSLLMFSNALKADSSVDPKIQAYIFPKEFNDAKVFIGFATKQSTGLKSHLALNQAVPTMERTAIDMSNQFVKEWNREMFYTAGVLCRCIYEYELSTLTKGNVTSSNNEALKIYARFQFGQSAPDADVGLLIKAGFWNCCQSTLVPTTQGVLPNSKAKLAEDAEPILRVTPYVLDKHLIGQLKELGMVRVVNKNDIIADLKSSPMTLEFASNVVKWLVSQFKAGKIKYADVNAYLAAITIDYKKRSISLSKDVTTSFLDGSLQFSEIRKSLPPSCLDIDIAEELGFQNLKNLGYKSLPLQVWAESRIAAEPTDVLSVCCRAWNNISQESQAYLISLFERTECIPTKYGKMYPKEVYIQEMKLFPLLPVVDLDLPSGWLKDIGIRESVDMNYVLEALQSKSLKWKNEDLVQYLIINEKRLKASDWRTVEQGSFFSDADGRFCVAKNLYAPDPTLKKLDFPVLLFADWNKNSKEAALMYRIGLRTFPAFDEVFNAECKKISEVQDDKSGSSAISNLSLKYFIDNAASAGYNLNDISRKRIIPTSNGYKMPIDVFTEPGVSLFGFPIIQNQFESDAAKLGIRKRPPLQTILSAFIHNDKFRTIVDSPEKLDVVLSYLSTLSGSLTQKDIEMLRSVEFIPIFSEKQTKWYSPDMVFFPNDSDTNDMEYLRPVLPTINVSQSAKPFLLALNVSNRPTLAQVMTLLIEKPEDLYRALDSPQIYEGLLMHLQANWSQMQKEPKLLDELRKSRFLLGIRYSEKNPEKKEAGLEKTLGLYKASELTIVNNVVIFNQFKTNVITAPQVRTLESFYRSLGVLRLTDLLEQKVTVGKPIDNPKLREDFENHVNERLQLYKKNAQDEEAFKNVSSIKVELVSSIHIRRNLPNQPIRVIDTSAFMTKQMLLYVAAPSNSKLENYKWLDMATTLSDGIMKRPTQDSAIIFEVLLSNDLETLEAKGYNVERIRNQTDYGKFNFTQSQAANNKPPQAVKSQKSSELPPPSYDSHLQKPNGVTKPTPPSPAFNSQPKGLAHAPPPVVPPQAQQSLKSLSQNLTSGSKDSKPTKSGSFWDLLKPSAKSQQPTTTPTRSSSRQPEVPPQQPVVNSTATNNGTNTVRTRVAVESNPQDRLSQAANMSRGCNESQFRAPKHIDSLDPSVSQDTPELFDLQRLDGTSVPLKVYTSPTNPSPQQNENDLASVLTSLSKVFGCSLEAVSIFRSDPSTKAFNRGGSLFFNSCAKVPSDISTYDYYYPIFAHELAHNLESSHGARHTELMGSYIQATLDAYKGLQ
ncbi:hypothetical protein DASB73_011350 [Starmerella bacillaris]|uniref:Sacsin/Nov domain-containing protein n=1 Tax=Starmerella bacillaris TaxID=1247836 RepID=A0AAV5RG38_STABA|nr:hypothetical protein DASB73_011350 [Starmerella bacillaris]